MDTGNYVQTSNRASWNEFQKAHLVELLVEFHQPGTRKQNGWSSAAWNDITRHVNAKFSNANFSLKQIKEQEHTLKKQFKIIQHLRNQPGFGWDITTKMVTAPEEVWAPLLKDKEIKRWYNKPFPYYDALHKVYCGFIASGKRKRRSNNFTNNEVEFEPTIPTIHAPREQPDVDVEENSSMSTQPNLNFSQEPSPIHPSISASWREETQLICMQNNSDTTAIHSEEFSVSSAVKTSEQEPNAWKKVVKHAQTCPTEPDHANLENNADLPKSPGLEPFMRNPILELPQGNMGMGQQGDPMARFRSFEMGQLQPFSYLSGNNRPSEAFEEMPGQPSTGQGMTMGNDMYCTQGYHFSIDDCIISPDIPGLESGTLPSPTPEFPPRNMNNSDRAAIHSEEFSVSAAVRTFQQLQGFSKADTVFAITMFIDNARVREAFLSCNEETRAPLIKAIVDQHKQKQKRPGEELEQDANQHCQIRVGMIRIFKDRSTLKLSMIGMSKRQYHREHVPSLREENLLFVALHESRGLEPFTPNPMPEFQQENMGMGKQVAPESNLVSDQLERFPSNASFNGYNEPNSSNLHADENFEGMLEDTTELPDLAGLEIPDLALLESDQWDEIDLSALLDGGSTSN